MTKVNNTDFRSIQFLALAGITGISTAYFSKIALVIGAGVFVVGFLQVLKTRNRGGVAHLFAGFLVGSEVYYRMSYVGLPWEFGKIAVVILLLTGMLVERQGRPKPIIFFLFGVLLIPAILVGEYSSMVSMKREIMFNLSGHLSLIVAIYYFSQRRMTVDDLATLFRWIVYGLIILSALLFIKVPEYGSIRYGGGSNFAASGGFGPNQVAAALGVGMLIMGYFLLIDKRLFIYKWLDIALLVGFALQGFFTLSRGGVFTAGIALSLGVLMVYLFHSGQVKRYVSMDFQKLGGLAIIILIVFSAADQVSGGAINKRYFNVDEYGHQIKKDYSTHRNAIVEADLETFGAHLFTGVGVGGSRSNRMKNTGISAVHVEFSRMLADHGVLGLIALLILFIYPIKIFLTRKNVMTRFALVIFVTFGLVTMSHNAMRLAMPGFFYGLGFILLSIRVEKHKIR